MARPYYGAFGVLLLTLIGFIPIICTKDIDKKIDGSFEEPEIVLDMTLQKSLRTNGEENLLIGKMIQGIWSRTVQNMKCIELGETVAEQESSRSIREVCGTISMIYLPPSPLQQTADTPAIRHTLNISSVLEQWPIWLQFLSFEFPFSYGCTESFVTITPGESRTFLWNYTTLDYVHKGIKT